MSLEIKKIVGKGIPIPGNDIDTDQIVPARFLKEITFDNMGKYLFSDIRFTETGSPKEHPLNDETYKDASIMVVGKNFGCGSSREHAPQAIKRAGFNAIIGESFAEIFAGNCKSLGVPTVTVSAEDQQSISTLVSANPNAEITIDMETLEITIADTTFIGEMEKAKQDAFLSGGWNAIAILKENEAAVSDLDQRLPY